MSEELQKKMDAILADWDDDPRCLRVSCNEPRWANWDGRGNLSALCKLHTEEALAGKAIVPPLPPELLQRPLPTGEVPSMPNLKPLTSPMGDALQRALKKP